MRFLRFIIMLAFYSVSLLAIPFIFAVAMVAYCWENSK